MVTAASFNLDPKEFAGIGFHSYQTLVSELRRRAVSAQTVLARRARRRGLPVVIDSMNKTYSGSPLCVAVKRSVGFAQSSAVQ